MYSIGFLFFLFIPTKQALHIFQQNHYHIDRYRIWLLDKFVEKKGNIFSYVLLFLPMFALLLISNHHNILALEALLLFSYAYIMMKLDDEKVYVKPFSYTHRIWRQLLCQYSFYLLCLLLLLRLPRLILVFVTPCFYFFAWLCIIMSGWCMKFIEKSIQNYYVKDAKTMLKNHQKLMKIGITGSYGKTSVKTILQQMLSNQYFTLMTPNSYNNLMGITLTIRQQLKSIHDVFICEMGADHIHEIEQLAKFVEPKIGVVTAIGPQHLQTFHTMEHIVHEKMQLIEQLPTNGIAILNKDNTYIRNYHIQNKISVIWFSIQEPSDYQACDLQYHALGMRFNIRYKHQTYAFETKLLGEHNVRNITSSVAIAHTLGIPMEKLQQTAKELPYVEHRLQLRKMPDYTLLDNAYNSNPEGAKESLTVLSQMPGKHIIITPGFIELGKVSEQAHINFGKQIAKCCDDVILIGKKQTLDIQKGLQTQAYPKENIHVVNTTQEALQLVKTMTTAQDFVLFENDLPDAFNH